MLAGYASLLVDKATEWAVASLTRGFPETADSMGVGLLASERQLELDPAASNATNAARLLAYVLQWRLAGTPIGLLLQLNFAGFAGAVVVQQNGLAHRLTGTVTIGDLGSFLSSWPVVGTVPAPTWYSRTVLPNGNPAIPASTDGKPAIPAMTVPWWSFDYGMDSAGNQFCSRFALVFPTGTTPSLGTASNLARLRRIIAAWKPAKATPVAIYVQTSGATWNQLGLLFGSFSWGGSSTFYSP